MTTEYEIHGDIIVVSISGDIVASTAESLRSLLLCMSTKGQNLVVISMDGVRFMDSFGLKLCMEIHLALRESGGRLVCAGPSEAVSKILSTTRASEKLNVVKAKEDGIRILEGLSAAQND